MGNQFKKGATAMGSKKEVSTLLKVYYTEKNTAMNWHFFRNANRRDRSEKIDVLL